MLPFLYLSSFYCGVIRKVKSTIITLFNQGASRFHLHDIHQVSAGKGAKLRGIEKANYTDSAHLSDSRNPGSDGGRWFEFRPIGGWFLHILTSFSSCTHSR